MFLHISLPVIYNCNNFLSDSLKTFLIESILWVVDFRKNEILKSQRLSSLLRLTVAFLVWQIGYSSYIWHFSIQKIIDKNLYPKLNQLKKYIHDSSQPKN